MGVRREGRRREKKVKNIVQRKVKMRTIKWYYLKRKKEIMESKKCENCNKITNTKNKKICFKAKCFQNCKMKKIFLYSFILFSELKFILRRVNVNLLLKLKLLKC